MANDPNPITLFVSILGLLGGSLSWILQLKIKHDILVNNEKLDQQMTQLREQHHRELSSVREEFIRELSVVKDKCIERIERLDRDLTGLNSGLGDRVLTTINGKYLRTDLHVQAVAGINERIVSLRQLLEVNLDKIEDGLERQIVDLKERILHKP